VETRNTSVPVRLSDLVITEGSAEGGTHFALLLKVLNVALRTSLEQEVCRLASVLYPRTIYCHEPVGSVTYKCGISSVLI
jgi:hypothetical protein